MIKITAGSDYDFEVQCKTNPPGSTAGVNVTVFQGTDALSASMFPGIGLASVYNPSFTWLDAPNGLAKLSILAAGTASLDEGTYLLHGWVQASGEKRLIIDEQIELSGSVGADAPETSLITYKDLKRYSQGLNLDEIQSPENGVAGFARERAEATRWLCTMVLKKWRGSQGGLTPTDYALDHLYWGLRLSLLPPVDMLGWLAAGGLMLDATDAATGTKFDLGVREVLAKYALSLICSSQLGKDAKSNQWAAFASMFSDQAENGARCLRVVIDTTGQGQPRVSVDLGLIDPIYS